jgi:hypothetical protein
VAKTLAKLTIGVAALVTATWFGTSSSHASGKRRGEDEDEGSTISLGRMLASMRIRYNPVRQFVHQQSFLRK